MSTKKSTRMSDKSKAFLESLTGKKMTLGNLLWSIRESEEMSQAEFAKLLRVSRQYLCDIERGRRIVSTKAAAEFATKLGYSPKQFIRLAIQDDLHKNGFHFDVEIHEHKDAA
ncbi:MAG: helix-turn-helix transcriptional regulator [Gammaproteobacteria bacterium]|nr:helix-turn-helix transcriptional regulator [Gammaproteobacteria bacterium]